jgi:hypothetical protein
MTVLSFTTGDIFTVRIIKSLTTNPDNKWSNSYEFHADEGGGESELLHLGEVTAEFEVALHRDTVSFERILISTWQPDSVPYDPSTFISSTLTSNGAVGPVGDNLALNLCLAVARVPASGRLGHLFYRGVLNEADTHAPAGKLVLLDKPGIQDNIDAALTSSGFEDFVGPSAEGGFRLVMVGDNPAAFRVIRQLRAQGVTTLPQDHAWFNRRTITVP